MTPAATPIRSSAPARHSRLATAVLGALLLAVSVGVSSAYFSSRISISQGFVAHIPTYPTPIAATVRVVPQTINLGAKGDVTAFIDELAAPHQLSEIQLSSITLCYLDACIASDGPAKLDGNGHVAATFARSAVARLVGTHRGDLILVVEGTLNGGGTLSGQHTNRVTGVPGLTQVTGTVRPAPPVVRLPAPTTDPTAAPTTDPTAAPTTDPTAAPTTDPTAAPTTDPTAAPTTDPTAAPTTDPTAAPTTDPTAAPTPDPTAAPTPDPTAAPTTDPTATPTPDPTASS